MMFSTAVGNPPFMRNLHLQIVDRMIPHIDKDGIGCFIHPARWFEDPLAEYKKDSDKNRFKGIVDRMEDVRILDNKLSYDEFGIQTNIELMISTLRSRPTGKKIELYNDRAQSCVDTILSYSKEQNLGMYVEQNKIDGWRVQIPSISLLYLNYDCNSEYQRKVKCNLLAMHKVSVFHNGFDGATEWMDTRKKTRGKKSSGTALPYSIKFKNKKEAVNFEKSCNTNFYNNILYLLKLDKNMPIRFLPWMGDYTTPWTDKDYCKFFGKIGMSKECQKWMCREVYDYRVKDFIRYDRIGT